MSKPKKEREENGEKNLAQEGKDSTELVREQKEILRIKSPLS